MQPTRYLRSPRLFRTAWILFVALGTPSCSVLVGNVRPVEERDHRYQVLNLSIDSPAEWRALSPASGAPSGSGATSVTTSAATTEVRADENGPDESDLAFQSRRTASIISLNSVCRASYLPKEGIDSLRQFSRQLLIGNFNAIENQSEKTRMLAGVEALETRIIGLTSGKNTERTEVQVIVLKKDRCVYDLMLLGRPETFARSQADFERFVNSLRFQ